jgi:DNA-binding NtrC family response regulator
MTTLCFKGQPQPENRPLAQPKISPRPILVVDDEESILQVLEARLASAGYAPLKARSAEKALEVLRAHPVDLVISDVKMPGMGGQGLLKEMATRWPGVPVILLTAYGAIPDAVAAIKDGAADYLVKPFDGKALLAKVAALLGPAQPGTARPGPAPDGPVSSVEDLSAVLWGGKSPVMRSFYDLLARVAPSEVNVLVLGESGTGKEMIARLLHDKSPRAKAPFVVVDCGSTPATLLESELFGHVKGSFTHALRDKKGLIEEADGGTLFLDEIGNISPEMQTRLLRFLQERTIRRVGDTRPITVSCRVIAATNADLPALVREGRFREDLYFRLKVVTLNVPPLRERREDIPLLAERFVAAFCAAQKKPVPRLAPETERLLATHAWPGNVRELRNALEAGVVLCRDGLLRPGDMQLEAAPDPGEPETDPVSLEDSEHQAILRALKQTGGVQTAAADLLGISRRTIHAKIKKYGITLPGKPGG